MYLILVFHFFCYPIVDLKKNWKKGRKIKREAL